VAALLVATRNEMSTSRAETDDRTAARLAPGEPRLIVPVPPVTSKSAAGPIRLYVPPGLVLPKPFTTVRPNVSSAYVTGVTGPPDTVTLAVAC
jgi:hypothetical protein